MALPFHKAAVLHGPRDIRIEDRPLWPPQRDNVQVAIKATGLCGSDRQLTSFTPYIVLIFCQSIIISKLGMATLLFRLLLYWVMSLRASSPPLVSVLEIFQSDNGSLLSLV